MKKVVCISILFSFCIASGSAQGTLQFNQVKLVNSTTSTVPSGKVWKITNVFSQYKTYYTANSGSGSCSSCNSGTQLWTSYNANAVCTLTTTAPVIINGDAVSFNNNSPAWLPAGTTLAGASRTCTPNGGWFGSSCGAAICPPPVTVEAIISLVEFNIVP